MFCSKCGNQNAFGANFCKKCGAKLITEEAAGQRPPPPPAQSWDYHQTGQQYYSYQNGYQQTQFNHEFIQFVDEYVRVNTKFKSAKDLLTNAKPLNIKLLIIIGFISLGFIIWLTSTGIGLFSWMLISIVSCVIVLSLLGDWLYDIQEGKLNTIGGFLGKVNPTDLVLFLNTNLNYLSSHFGEWEDMQMKTSDKISDKILGQFDKLNEKTSDKLGIEPRERSVKMSLECKFQKNITLEIKFLYYVTNEKTEYIFNANIKKSCFISFFDILSVVDIFREHNEFRCLYMTSPILQAAMEYYFKLNGGNVYHT